MKGILFLAILCVSSSYKSNTEIDLSQDEGVPDTVQWWISEGGVWRIRTFAMDHDIHVYSVSDSPDGMIELVRENTDKHFGDISCGVHEWNFDDAADRANTDAVIAASGLEPRLEIEPGRFVFWKPDHARYWSQSHPDEQD